MIYTVTFSPSLDYVVSVKDFALGVVNRTAEEYLVPGGKGINVKLHCGTETEINGQGPAVSPEDIRRLYRSWIPRRRGQCW